MVSLRATTSRRLVLLDYVQRRRFQSRFKYSLNGPSVLPSIAPRPSIDVKSIREKPDLYSQNCLERNYKPQASNSFTIVKIFRQWLDLQRDSRGLRQRSNVIRTQLAHAKTYSGREAGGKNVETEEREDLLEEARQLKDRVQVIEAAEKDLSDNIESLAADLPNLTSHHTPRGNEPRLLGHLNEHPNFPSTSSDRLYRNHVRLGTEFDILNFTAAATTSGWGWYYLKNEAALLEQALIQYALVVARAHGFTVISPPSMVYSHIAAACGFRPRDQSGEQQVYTIHQNEAETLKDKPGHSLAGTAEIPLAGMKANELLEHSDLPLRVVGSSRCYRAEAGARGTETKGLYRVHEFTKVEMFAWTLPGRELDMFNSMVKIQTEILTDLGLHCRILEMPSTDLGASAVRKQDIEAYFPSRREKDGGWGEVTSTSICTDYQTRRLNTRVRIPDGPGAKTDFPSTVNGTALAVPRILAAILENGWQKDEECIRIPEVLWPYMHGTQVIEKKRQRRVQAEALPK